MTTIAGYDATTKTLNVAELKKLTIHRRAGIFRPLQDDERDRLRTSIRAGFDEAHPIVVWAQTNEIVDGRNRRDLAVELKCSAVPVAYVVFPDEAVVRTYIVAQNLARRHLDYRERCELAARLVNGDGLSTRQAAKVAGVSQSTARRVAAADRSGESRDSPVLERVNGSDGKSYPATKPKTTRKPRRTTKTQTQTQTQTICPTCGGSGHVP